MSPHRMVLAYDGTGYRGYARQEGVKTVQGELEAALHKVLGHPVETAVAGRTDAGVHARGQVVSFDAEDADVEQLRRSLNGILGPEIRVRELAIAPTGFHARFSARWRRYRYVIDRSPAPDPLTRHWVWHVGRELDLAEMRAVAATIIGEHDFSTFCRTMKGSSNVRDVGQAEWRELEDGLLEFWIQANSFCQQMVRSIVGYSYDVGRGFSDASRAVELIAARDRSQVATVAPPHGLILWQVGY